MEVTPLIIAGHDVTGDGPELEVINPADSSLIGKVRSASPEQVDLAVSAGQQAFHSNGWKERLPNERAEILRLIAEKIRLNTERLAELQMRENGKTRSDSLAQAKAAASYFQYFASVCEVIEDSIPPSRGNYLILTAHEPYGVVAAMTPWNSPLTMAAQKIAPALAAGNAVVLKAAETTSLVSLELGKYCIDAGLPEGLLSIITGKADTGHALVTNKKVDLISFTGGTETGQSIAREVSHRLLPMVLELGGKSPHIVCADADMDAAVHAVASGIFGGAGQSCVAGSRLFIEETVRDEFLNKLQSITGKMIVGDPSDAKTIIGPLSSFTHRERIENYVKQAVAQGGEILLGGERPEADELSKGAYYLPTIIGGLSNSAKVVQEEIFGPVLCVLPFSSEEELITQANDSIFGLAAGIWTSQYPRAWRIAKALQAGTVWINSYKQLAISAPFGGYKLSGFGREKGIQGMRAYQQTKSIYWGM